MSADVASTTDAWVESDAAPTSDPVSLTDTAQTGDVALPPTTYEVPPRQTDTPPTGNVPPPVDTSAATTPDTAVPETPANDASAPVDDQVPSTSSDSTDVPASPSPVPQDTSQAVSNSGNTASIPDPEAVPDVTGVTQDEVTSTTETATPPAQLPAEPVPVLDTSVVAVLTETDDVSTRRRSAAPDGRALSPLLILRLLAQTSGASFAGNETAIQTLLDGTNQNRTGGAASAFGTSTGLAATSSRSTAALAVTATVLPRELKTFLHAAGQVIAVVSLSAMIVAALPGLAGLVIPGLAGTAIGYRQAKALRSVRTSGIGYLAASTPIGVVRSGSLVALRSRRSRPSASVASDRFQDVA